jgi:hypothetical protein
MSEVSIILKDIRVMTLPEFKALDRYASTGRMWSVISRMQPVTMKSRSIEYIFEEENFILFKLVSANIFAQWFTENTRRLKAGEEYQLDYNLFIRLQSYGF